MIHENKPNLEDAVALKERFAAWNSSAGWADVCTRLNGVTGHLGYLLGALAYLYAGYTVMRSETLILLWAIPGMIGLNMWAWKAGKRISSGSDPKGDCDEHG